MFKVIKNKLSDGGQFIYDHLTPSSFKGFLKNSLSDERKDRLRKLLGAGHKQARMRKVNQAKYRLKNLGFQTAGYEELSQLFEQTDDHLLKDLAGFELALWHADQYDQANAQKSIDFLNQLRTENISDEQVRKRTIVMVENLYRLDQVDQAKGMLTDALSHNKHADLYLAYADITKDIDDKLNWINKALGLYDIAPVYLSDETDKTLYDRLQVKQLEPDPEQNQAKITIILPVYNAGEQVRTAIDSVLSQTWGNIEVIIVDDCSTDHTAEIAKSYVAQDNRVIFLQTPENSGPYTARNIALGHATGDFVTINDADDWSHPEKLARQAKHLLKYKKVMGNTSQQARAMENLRFYRRGKPGLYIFSNMSSFMFRRKEVLAQLGHWDSVRFAADSEFILRIKKVFGEKSVVEAPLGPLSFQRQSEDSLTGNSAFGFPGYFMGVRKEYREVQIDHHQTTDDLYYPYPQENRPFQTPTPLLPKQKNRSFDLIYSADFRSDNQVLDEIIDELKILVQRPERFAVVQTHQFHTTPDEPISTRVRELLNQYKIDVLCYGEKTEVARMIIRTANAFRHHQVYLPEVKAEVVEVISKGQLSNTQTENIMTYLNRPITIRNPIELR